MPYNFSQGQEELLLRPFLRITNSVFLLEIFECVIAWNKIFSNEKLDSYFSQSVKESAINSVNMVFH